MILYNFPTSSGTITYLFLIYNLSGATSSPYAERGATRHVRSSFFKSKNPSRNMTKQQLNKKPNRELSKQNKSSKASDVTEEFFDVMT